MGANLKTALLALGGLVIGGVALWAARRVNASGTLAPSESLDALPPDNYECRTPPPTNKAPSYHRQSPSSPKGPLTVMLSPELGLLKVYIKKPKFLVSYDKGNWSDDSDLFKLFNPGEIISNEAGNRLIANFGINMGSRVFAIASTPAEMIGFATNPLTIGEEPPGVKSTVATSYDSTVAMLLMPGNYVVTPASTPYQQHSESFYTGFWKWSMRGPRIPSSSWFIDRLMAGKCTKWWTKVTMSNGGSPLKSMQTVQISRGKTTTITLQPINIISLRRKLWQNSESRAFNATCEVFGLGGEYLPDWVQNLLSNFAKWVG